MFTLYLLVALVSYTFAACNPQCVSDSVPSNPGISSNLLTQTANYGTYIPANYSEVVNIYSMGTLPLPQWQRDNCPHLQPNLVNFTTLFTTYTSGMSVTIPAGTNALFQANKLPSNPTFTLINIYGNLIFDDQNLNLNVAEIRVQPNASLQIGSLSCRLFASITITFTGSKTTSSQIFWDSSLKPSKGIMSQGSVDIHGKQYHPTWTRLSRNAPSGKTVIVLQDVVNWEVGQLILITTSAWFDCSAALQRTYCQNRPHQNEIRMITGIQQTTSGEQALLLNASLTYSHYAGKEYQVEVALLSRRINLAGALSNDNFGGHVLTAMGGSGRFSGVRGDRMGQLNVLGRYPFHFHMLYDGSTSVIQDCVVTNSYFRAYTVHGTNNTLVTRNVAYGILGHAYYLESGTEENNVFSYNFAAQVTPIGNPAQGGWCGCAYSYVANATFLNPSDVSASGFYILNAYNTFIGNVAVGGASGYIFPNAPLPIFTSTSLNYGNNNPQNRPLLSFVGNTAHSTGFYWPEQGPGIYVGGQLWVDANGVLNYNPGRYSRSSMLPDGTPVFMTFTDTKVFLSNKGVLHWGNASQHFDLEVHDLGFAGVFLFSYSGINNVLFTAASGNTYNGNYVPAKATSQTRGGIQFYDTVSRLIISNVTFRNYQSGDTAIYFLDGSDQYLPQGISATQGISYQNFATGSKYIYIQNCGASASPYNGCGVTGSDGSWPSQSSLIQSILDYDGTASRTPGTPKIVGGFGKFWNQGADCVYDSTAHTRTCNWNTNRGTAYVNAGNGGLIKGCQSGICAGCPTYSQQCCYTIGHVSLWGSLAASTQMQISPWGGTTGPLNTGWYMRMYVAPDPGYTLTSIGFVTGGPKQWNVNQIQIPRGGFIVQAIAYPPTATFTVNIQFNGVNYLPVPQASSYSEIIANTEDLLDPIDMNCTLNNTSDIDDWCQYTGATGPMWYFDGNYLYLRIVNPSYYTVKMYQQAEPRLDFMGATLYEQDTRWNYLSIVQSCVGCTNTTSFTGWYYYNVNDVPPPQDFPVYTGSLNTVPVYTTTSIPLTGSPSITCSAPVASNYPHASLGSCTLSAAVDTACTLSCASGYTAYGDMAIYCLDTGLWSGFDSGSGCF